MIDADEFPECEVKPRYAPCHKCGKPVDMSKIYAKVFPRGEEHIYHIECFHEDYKPMDADKYQA